MSFLGDANRNADSRMASMGVPSGPGDPMAGQGKQPMGDVNYRAAGTGLEASTGPGAPLPGPDPMGGAPSMGGAPPVGGAPSSAGGSCGSCSHFDGQQTCDIVAGNIDPMAVCDLFEPAGAAAGPPPGAAAPPAGPAGGDEGEPGFR